MIPGEWLIVLGGNTEGEQPLSGIILPVSRTLHLFSIIEKGVMYNQHCYIYHKMGNL